MRRLLAVVLLGCGSSVEATPTDASVSNDTSVSDTRSETSRVDTPCEIGAVPSVPKYAYEFLFVGGDGGVTIPTPTGGDPIGEWRYTKVTVYLSDSARMFVDPSKSTIDGTGFGSYTASGFRNTTDQKATIHTTVVGPQVRETRTRAKGTWNLEGSEIVYTVECVESTTEASLSRVGFSRIDADHARLQFKPPAGSTGPGDFTQQIVIDLERIK